MDIERIYDQHAWHVVRRARFLLKDDAEAWDVCQDVFLKLAEQPARVRDPARVAAWLYRASTNRCIDRLRARKPTDRTALAQLASRLDLEDRAACRELVGLLAWHMPAAEMRLAVLRYVDGLTMNELERVCGKTRKTLAKQLKRFQKRAQAILAGHTGQGATR